MRATTATGADMSTSSSAAEVVGRLWALRSDGELPKVRRHLAEDEEAFGLRMRDLFDPAERDRPLARVAARGSA